MSMMNHRQFENQNKERREQAKRLHVGALVAVTSFDPKAMTVCVQPISKRLADGVYDSQPPVLGLPVAPTRSGGYITRPWYVPGDVGVILYIDHDIDKAVESGAECEPNTERNHSESDAVFLGGFTPGSKPAPDLPGEALVLAKDDGSVYIAVKQDRVEVKGDLYVTGTVFSDTEVDAQGVKLTRHRHSGVEPGSGTTGQPTKG